MVTEVGCLRCDFPIAYRAGPPHSGALLRQQQMQASVLIRKLTGLHLSYSGRRESQFAGRTQWRAARDAANWKYLDRGYRKSLVPVLPRPDGLIFIARRTSMGTWRMPSMSGH